jgi:hypothetical protein
VLDLVINLDLPPKYHPREGLRDIVKFEKSRGLWGDDVERFEVRFATEPAGPAWTFKSCDGAVLERIIDLFIAGRSGTDIAREVGLDKSTVSRKLSQARKVGKVR